MPQSPAGPWQFQVVAEGQATVLRAVNRELLAKVLSKPELIQCTFLVMWLKSPILNSDSCCDPPLYTVCGSSTPQVDPASHSEKVNRWQMVAMLFLDPSSPLLYSLHGEISIKTSHSFIFSHFSSYGIDIFWLQLKRRRHTEHLREL